MALFEVPKRTTKSNDMKIAKKSNTKAIATPTTIKGGGSLIDRINLIKSMVETNLGKYKEEYQVINDKDILHDFINECIGNGYISIDTETDGLDPLQNTLAGICPYTYGQKGAYIPLNHISYITNEKASGQLEMEFVMSEFKRLLDKKPEIDMFNAKFDIRFLRANGLHNIYCTWDGYLASRLLNENEEHKNLKQLHNKYCLDGKGDAFRFDDLFKGIPFTMIPYNVGYLYAAHDPHITTELCDYQRKWLREDSDREDMQKLYWVFENIEMPCVDVICNMEDNGILFDMNYQQQLSEKYNKLLEEKKQNFYKICDMYKEEIDRYKNSYTSNWNDTIEYKIAKGFGGDWDITEYETHKNDKVKGSVKLDDPINISSPTQLAILFYDILKCPVIDKKSPRGTGVDILSKMDNPLAKAVLEYRTVEKLISTYIDKLPNCVNPKDGRIHCSFNQYGADCITGDSLLLTNDGYIQISSIFTDDDVDGKMISNTTTIVNKDLSYEQSSHRVVYHNTDTIKITLRGGYSVEGTPNHPIIVSDINIDDIRQNKSERQIRRLKETEHFERLENLKIGDTVAIPYGYNIFPTSYQKLDCKIKQLHHTKNKCVMPEYCNEEFAELLGMYHADGTFKYSGDKFVICINNSDKDVTDRVEYLAKSLFNLDSHIYSDSRTNGGGICFGSLQISEMSKYLVKGARNKFIPEIIMKSPKSVVCAYIKGMTLDSTFDKVRQRLFLSCVDKVSFNFLQDSLSNMGILTQVRYGEYKEGCDHMGNDVQSIQVRRLGICGEMYGSFLKQVGVVQSSKALYLDKYKKSQYLTYNNVYYAYVTKVEKSVNDVYDLHIPKSHSFIANSMINHNTGRMSSSEPNLQNIPSHNKDIRKMFVASEGYVLMSSDYSQQEPRSLAALCKKHGDSQMYDTFMQGKDLYSEIASKAFNKSYEDCKEFRPDGTTNKEGKERRSRAKSILLG